LTCPECGSYQPDGIKFCGICGVPLTADGHISQFLLNAESEGGGEIELPRRRGAIFYLTVIFSTLLILALVGGLAFLLYYVTRTENAPEAVMVEVTDENITDYATPDGVVSFSYPLLWDLQEVNTTVDQLDLQLQLTDAKKITITAERMEPDLMLGGMEDIRYYVTDKIARDLAATRTGPSEPPPDAVQVSDDLLSLTINGQTAYAYKTEIDVNKRRTTVYYYFIVSNELLYELRGTSPTDIWGETMPDFTVIAGTFRTVQAE
jgi:hypothetical protein